MLTMSSLVAQNQFGTLIDASQRQPVTVTRHGRPVAVVMSYEDYQGQPANHHTPSGSPDQRGLSAARHCGG